MSAGAFTLARYASNEGGVYPIRVQPETLLANIGGVNASAAGTVDQEVSAQVSKGRRSIGMNARTVTVRFTGALPDGYAAGQTYRIPIMTAAIWNGIKRGNTGTYLGSPVVVVGKQAEQPR